jgi:hypothetical protein
MSAYKNTNMPGVRKIEASQISIRLKDIKEMTPRRAIVDERKSGDTKNPPPAK